MAFEIKGVVNGKCKTPRPVSFSARPRLCLLFGLWDWDTDPKTAFQKSWDCKMLRTTQKNETTRRPMNYWDFYFFQWPFTTSDLSIDYMSFRHICGFPCSKLPFDCHWLISHSWSCINSNVSCSGCILFVAYLQC